MDLANKVLAKCAANDQTFPQPSEAVRLAWAEHIGMTNLSLDDLLAAVTTVYGAQLSPGFRMLPGHLIAAAHGIRNDRLQRRGDEPPPVTGNPEARRDRYGYIDKSAKEPGPQSTSEQQRLTAYWKQINVLRDEREIEAAANYAPGSRLLNPPASPETRAAAMAAMTGIFAGVDEFGDASPTGPNVLLVACPWCHAAAGEHCTTTGMAGKPREQLKKTRGHPSRIEAAQRLSEARK
jgi:hypothetical protein